MPEEETLANFATRDELITFWRPLETAETERADVLLDYGSNRLRMIAEQTNIDLDQKAEDSEVYAKALKFILLEAVKRALQTPQNVPPVNSFQQTAGPYSENYVFTNPSGDLWFKKADLALLGLGGKQKVSSINGTQADIYGENDDVDS